MRSIWLLPGLRAMCVVQVDRTTLQLLGFVPNTAFAIITNTISGINWPVIIEIFQLPLLDVQPPLTW